MQKLTVYHLTERLYEGRTGFHRKNAITNIHLFRINNRKTGVVLVFLLLTLSIFHTPFCNVSIVKFEQVNVKWVLLSIYCCQKASTFRKISSNRKQ